jgi:hypothetical protein
MLLGDGAIEGRYAGRTHRLSVDGDVAYAAPTFSARLAPATLAVMDATPSAEASDGQRLSLEPAADLYVLLQGLQASLPHLPRAAAPEAGTRIVAPAYADSDPAGA